MKETGLQPASQLANGRLAVTFEVNDNDYYSIPITSKIHAKNLCQGDKYFYFFRLIFWDFADRNFRPDGPRLAPQPLSRGKRFAHRINKLDIFREDISRGYTLF